MPIKVVIFDMAGTTVRDNGEVVAAFTTALQDHGLEIPPAKLNKVRGSSKRAAIFALLPGGHDRKSRAERIYTTFAKKLAETYRLHGVDEIEGAKEVFGTLHDRGIRVALTTGFDRDITRLLVDALGWTNQQIDAVVCSDDVSQGRPAPDLIFRAMKTTATTDPAQVANVGDTVVDLQAGYNAGVKMNIAVLTGAHERALLEQEPHTHIVESIIEVPQLLLDC